MAKNNMMALFKSPDPTGSGEEQLQAMIEKLGILKAEMKAAYEKEISDIVAAVERYKADAAKLLEDVHADVERRSGKTAALNTRKDTLMGQIEAANTRLSELLYDGSEEAQEKVLDEIQKLTAKLDTLDRMTETINMTSYSLPDQDRKLVESLHVQAEDITDMMLRANAILEALREAVRALAAGGPFSDPYLFLYGHAGVNHNLAVEGARSMPGAQDFSRIFPFFSQKKLTVGEVLRHFEEDRLLEPVVSPFTHKKDTLGTW